MFRLMTTLAAAAALAGLAPAAALAGGGTTTGADLQTSGSASTGSPIAGAPFTYTFQVKNSGPQDATAASFSDQLPDGTTFDGANVNNGPSTCTAAGGAVRCGLGTLAKGGQATVTLFVHAPQAGGTYANTGTASSDVADPAPANNAATVSVKVQPLPTCALPAGQTTLHGLVMWKSTNSSGLFENFELSSNGVNYYVRTNFYDGTQPLTSIINLLCKPVSTVFVQVGNFIDVTGTDGGTIVLPGTSTPTPVLDASVIQVPFTFDKAL